MRMGHGRGRVRSTRPLWAAAVGLAIALCGALVSTIPAGSTPAPKAATDTVLTPDGAFAPDALYPAEVEALGEEHAQEHLAERAEAKKDEESDVGELAPAPGGTSNAKTPKDPPIPPIVGPPDQVGTWARPFIPAGLDEDDVGVHSILLKTGKVLLFGGYSEEGGLVTASFVFDPATSTVKTLETPQVFCSGHIVLTDGRVLVVGGRLSTAHPTPGTVGIWIFDPITETWSHDHDMANGRYYPTVTELADGRALITTGNGTTGKLNRTVEVWTPPRDGQASKVETVGPQVVLDLYPKQWVMPDGKVLVVQHKLVSLLDPTRWTWTKLANLQQTRKNNPGGVLLPGPPSGSTRVLMTGGETEQRGATTASTEIFDEANIAAGWHYSTPLPQGRAHMNTVLLPDSTILGVGGNSTDRFNDPTNQTLVFDPATEVWTPMAIQASRRAYHSTAVLLPDGRVLSAGDTGPGGGNQRLEIYSPTYFYKGPRPVITSPTAGVLGYGTPFSVSTDGPVTRAVLIHPGAVTHANDMSQRLVELQTSSVDAHGLHLVSPPSATVAPPGDYMLFVLNSAGVPSVAQWVHIGRTD